MALSLKIVLGIAVYYIILGAVLGNLGLAIASETDAVNSLSELDDINVSTDVGLTEITSFWQGLMFSVDNMPWWLDMFLVIIIPVSGTLAGLWMLRGI